MSTVISVENVSKMYRLGEVGTGTISHDLNRWWHKVRGKDDPYLKIGESNDRGSKGSSEYVYALKDINFEVKEGEVLGIIGKNGAGKSTLLKLLSRVTSPTSGRIRIKGRTASLLEVGTGFHPELTGRENIFLNGAILGMTKAEIRSKFDEIVDFSGVERYIDTPVKRYSSGMYVRLAFAVAAHLDPEILIVDEVLAVGDAEFQKKCLGKMGDISKNEGRTILFVSHNMATIQKLCQHILLLHNGSILKYSDSNSTINYYMQIDSSAIGRGSNFSKRIGNGLLQIQDIDFLDFNTLNKVNVLLSGSKIIVRIRVQLKDLNSNFNNLRVAIGFRNKNGCESFAIDSFFVGKSYSTVDLNTKMYFDCLIEKWPLNAGIYDFRVHIEENNEIIDRIEDAGQIVVEYGDFFGYGFKVSTNLDGCLIDQEWL